MKNNFSLIFCFILFSFPQDRGENLFGKWQLRKIEIAGLPIIPNKVKYFVEFSPDNMKYNLAINHCWSNSLKIDSKNILCKDITSTLICCDEREDSISKFIDYRGVYEIKDSLLIISNTKGIFYLYRMKD